MKKAIRTLNLGAGYDAWGTDKLDREALQKGVRVFDLNSGKRLPYQSGTFDEIRLRGVIEFLVYPQFVLNECYRVLKKGGKLDIKTVNMDSLRFFLSPFRGHSYRGRRMIIDNGPVIEPWNAYFLTNRLNIAGFKRIEIEKFSNIFPFKDMIRAFAKK